MNFRIAISRGLLPACAVAGVIAVSLQGPLALTASGVGYGGYNCGVKGIGYHDHGKLCPNRPFPGKGIDKSKSAQTGAEVNEATSTGTADETTTAATIVASTGSEEATGGADSLTTTSAARGHGHGHGHGKGHK